MQTKYLLLPLATLALATLATPVPAAPADPVAARVQGYRDLGAAFKALNDGLRAPSPQQEVLSGAVRRIGSAAKLQYSWFPGGSGPRPGRKTAAKAEIWSQGANFRKAQNAFATQSAALERAVAGGDVAAMRKAARSLGASCKGCHDQYRSEAK